MLHSRARGVVSKEGKAGLRRVPHADHLVQRLDELHHRGGPVKAHHLRNVTHKMLAVFQCRSQKASSEATTCGISRTKY